MQSLHAMPLLSSQHCFCPFVLQVTSQLQYDAVNYEPLSYRRDLGTGSLCIILNCPYHMHRSAAREWPNPVDRKGRYRTQLCVEVVAQV